MPILTRMKRRSGGGHGFFSSSHITAISEPTRLVKVSGMSNTDVSKLIPSVRQEIGTEPLFDPHRQMHDVQDDNAHLRKQSSFTQQASSTVPARNEPLGSHPTQPLSDTEEAAPPPPDFTRRGIHIPTRTRCVALSLHMVAMQRVSQK